MFVLLADALQQVRKLVGEGREEGRRGKGEPGLGATGPNQND